MSTQRWVLFSYLLADHELTGSPREGLVLRPSVWMKDDQPRAEVPDRPAGDGLSRAPIDDLVPSPSFAAQGITETLPIVFIRSIREDLLTLDRLRRHAQGRHREQPRREQAPLKVSVSQDPCKAVSARCEARDAARTARTVTSTLYDAIPHGQRRTEQIKNNQCDYLQKNVCLMDVLSHDICLIMGTYMHAFIHQYPTH